MHRVIDYKIMSSAPGKIFGLLSPLLEDGYELVGTQFQIKAPDGEIIIGQAVVKLEYSLGSEERLKFPDYHRLD